MTMKAAVLNTFGSPLAIETLPDPALGTGEVIVDVVATAVLSYTKEVFSGERNYPLTLPVAPGCAAIGRVPDCRTRRDTPCSRRLGRLRPDRAVAGRWAGA
jgi:NADPH:quinone reductase-like Zn-dependent oxidoreductase